MMPKLTRAFLLRFSTSTWSLLPTMSLRTSTTPLRRTLFSTHRSPPSRLRPYSLPPPSPPSSPLRRRALPLILSTSLSLTLFYLLSPSSFSLLADSQVTKNQHQNTESRTANPTLARKKPKDKIAESKDGGKKGEFISLEEVERHRGRQNGGEEESVWVVVNGDVWE
jgi:hypothetical protein